MFSEKFICAGYDYTTYTSHVPAPYFRKTFEIDGARAEKQRNDRDYRNDAYCYLALFAACLCHDNTSLFLYD